MKYKNRLIVPTLVSTGLLASTIVVNAEEVDQDEQYSQENTAEYSETDKTSETDLDFIDSSEEDADEESPEDSDEEDEDAEEEPEEEDSEDDSEEEASGEVEEEAEVTEEEEHDADTEEVTEEEVDDSEVDDTVEEAASEVEVSEVDSADEEETSEDQTEEALTEDEESETEEVVETETASEEVAEETEESEAAIETEENSGAPAEEAPEEEETVKEQEEPEEEVDSEENTAADEETPADETVSEDDSEEEITDDSEELEEDIDSGENAVDNEEDQDAPAEETASEDDEVTDESDDEEVAEADEETEESNELEEEEAVVAEEESETSETEVSNSETDETETEEDTYKYDSESLEQELENLNEEERAAFLEENGDDIEADEEMLNQLNEVVAAEHGINLEANEVYSSDASTFSTMSMSQAITDINEYIAANDFDVAEIQYDLIDGLPQYAFESDYGNDPENGKVGQPSGVVLHDVGNENSTIHGEINHMSGNWENAFVHAFVDADNIIQVANTDYLAYGAGPVSNQTHLHVELVRHDNQHDFARSINNYADYIANLLYKYKLPAERVDASGNGTLWSHVEVSHIMGGTASPDPYEYFASHGYEYNDVISLIDSRYNDLYNKVTDPSIYMPTFDGDTENLGAAVTDQNRGIYESITDVRTNDASSLVGEDLRIVRSEIYNYEEYYLLENADGTEIGWMYAGDVMTSALDDQPEAPEEDGEDETPEPQPEPEQPEPEQPEPEQPEPEQPDEDTDETPEQPDDDNENEGSEDNDEGSDDNAVETPDEDNTDGQESDSGTETPSNDEDTDSEDSDSDSDDVPSEDTGDQESDSDVDEDTDSNDQESDEETPEQDNESDSEETAEQDNGEDNDSGSEEEVENDDTDDNQRSDDSPEDEEDSQESDSDTQDSSNEGTGNTDSDSGSQSENDTSESTDSNVDAGSSDDDSDEPTDENTESDAEEVREESADSDDAGEDGPSGEATADDEDGDVYSSLEDPATGVRVYSESDELEGKSLVVTVLGSSDAIGADHDLYDIHVLDEDGSLYSLQNPVTVHLPAGGYVSNVYYLGDIGETLEAVNYRTEDGYAVFETSSFSQYAVVYGEEDKDNTTVAPVSGYKDTKGKETTVDRVNEHTAVYTEDVDDSEDETAAVSDFGDGSAHADEDGTEEVKETESEVLPNTGVAEQSTTIFATILAALGLGFLVKRRKTTDK